MMSFHVIGDLGLPQSKILGTFMNWRSPKNFFEDLFFFRTLAAVFLVLGLEHPFPWPREVCPRKGCPWLWPRIFFVSLVSSLVSSTPRLLPMKNKI